jgi:chitodextrinase
MKKVLSIVLTASVTMLLMSGTAFAGTGNGHGNGNHKDWEGENSLEQSQKHGFKDMKGHWGNDCVERMQTYGILNGYADGTFQPDKILTQGELAVIIDRLLNITRTTDEDSDNEAVIGKALSCVPDWAKEAVKKGLHKKYLNMKRFHAQVQCDRLTAAVAIAKALGLEPVTDFTTNPFKDRGLISDEDYGYLLALYQEGYINGFPDGNFNPDKPLSRAQIASILTKLLENGGSPATDDKTAPTWEDNSTITASAVKANGVTLTWSGAKDDKKVVEYKVSYKLDGKDKVKYVTEKTVSITGLEADETYTFTVEAKDAAGNLSDDGPSIRVTTLEDDNDTEAPTWTTNSVLTVSSSVSGAVTLVWPDAKDNVGVDAYKVYQDGQLIKALDADKNSVNITGLKSDTEYIFKVRAVDKAGNLSISLIKSFLTE